jgi:hypothetical protein
MQQMHLERLGATVTIAPSTPAARTVRVDELTQARRTQGELLLILVALSASDGATATMLRAATAMAERVAARLDAMGAD